jgi:hypothetical protein
VLTSWLEWALWVLEPCRPQEQHLQRHAACMIRMFEMMDTMVTNAGVEKPRRRRLPRISVGLVVLALP